VPDRREDAFRRENPMKWFEASQARRRAAAACDLNQR